MSSMPARDASTGSGHQVGSVLILQGHVACTTQQRLAGFISHDGSMVLVYMLTFKGYIDGIHGTPYIAAPWILWVFGDLKRISQHLNIAREMQI